MRIPSLPSQKSSLRRRLPALIGLLIFAGVAVFAGLAYRTVKSSLMRAAELRLTTMAAQFAPGIGANLETRAHALGSLARDPAFTAQLNARPGRTIAAAHTMMALLSRDTAAVIATELRDADGRVMLSVGKPATSDTTADAGRLAARTLDTNAVSGLYERNGLVVYELRGNIVRDGRVIGQLAEVRPAETRDAAALRQLTTVAQLIGSDGTYLLGNADGSLWTDMRGTVQRPPPGSGLVTYVRDSQPKLSVAQRIPNSPLVLAFEFNATHVIGPLHALLGRFAAVAALVVLVGALLGWWMSRGITRPLSRLTEAAEAISAGDLDRPPLPIERDDELGRLSRAFAIMTGNVRAAHENLEQQVEARTAELQRAQEENVRRERLATLGQLSSSVGHELRNPLGVMSNVVYFLDATMASPSPKTAEYLHILKSQISLSEKIVADLLDFARVKAPQREPLAMGTLVDDQLRRASIPPSITVERQGDPATVVSVDPVQIGQVVLNLFTNAAQAMEDTGGTLGIAWLEESGAVSLRVSDTGPGIATEHLTRIFDPLFTTKARGIGLGLSVSRSLAEANGGTLTVESTPGAGATFTLKMVKAA